MAMPPYGEVAREWVQSAHVQAWLARVLEDLGGEHPVPALPSCGLCDAFVLVLLESLPNLDSTLCKSKCVALHAWLYNLLGGAAEKLVTPPSKGNDATRCLLSAATTGCKRFCKLAISRQTGHARLKLGSGVGWRSDNCHFGGVRGGSPAKKKIGLRLCGTHFLSLCSCVTSRNIMYYILAIEYLATVPASSS